jgi:magnesium-transporting ATPase (P-type)
MFVWTSIAVIVLSQNYRLENFSALTMILIQYLFAMLLVFSTIFISSFFVTISPNGYKDAFQSFTIPYMIGAGFYYISLYRFIKNGNKTLKVIKDHLDANKN